MSQCVQALHGDIVRVFYETDCWHSERPKVPQHEAYSRLTWYSRACRRAIYRGRVRNAFPVRPLLHPRHGAITASRQQFGSSITTFLRRSRRKRALFVL